MGVDEVWENQASVKVKKTKVGDTDYKVKVSSCNNIVAAPVYFHKEKTQRTQSQTITFLIAQRFADLGSQMPPIRLL